MESVSASRQGVVASVSRGRSQHGVARVGGKPQVRIVQVGGAWRGHPSFRPASRSAQIPTCFVGFAGIYGLQRPASCGGYTGH